MSKSIFWRGILNHYPQNNWAKALTIELKKLNLARSTKVVDAPCGNGAITFWLANTIKNKFELIDRSKLFTTMIFLWSRSNEQICLKNGDLFYELERTPSDDVWLLINSLYLFPNPLEMITMYRPRFKYILAIFPYLDKINYHYFCKRPFRSSNTKNYTLKDTISIFSDAGYDLQTKIDLTAIPFFKYDLLGLGSILRYLLGQIDKEMSPVDGQYWLGVFVRKDNS